MHKNKYIIETGISMLIASKWVAFAFVQCYKIVFLVFK